MGLAIAAIVKGYKCIFTTTDKQSKEKVDALRAFGAEVIVCPTDVDPEDPRSYYSVSSRLVRETPELLEGQPVRQPVELGGPLRDHRPRDSGSRRAAPSTTSWWAWARAARCAARASTSRRRSLR
jgi:cysteine synthase